MERLETLIVHAMGIQNSPQHRMQLILRIMQLNQPSWEERNPAPPRLPRIQRLATTLLLGSVAALAADRVADRSESP